MRINVKLDYDAQSSRPTSRLSVSRRQAQPSGRFKSAVLKLPHLDQVSLNPCNNNKADKYDNNKEAALLYQSPSLAFHDEESGEKHHHQNEKRKDGKKNQYQYQYDRYEQIQHGQPQPSASKSRYPSGPDELNVIRGYDVMRKDDARNDHEVERTRSDSSASDRNVRRGKDCERVSSGVHRANQLY